MREAWTSKRRPSPLGPVASGNSNQTAVLPSPRMNPQRWLIASSSGSPRPPVDCALVRQAHGGSVEPPSSTHTRTMSGAASTVTLNSPPAPDRECRIAFVASSLVSSTQSSCSGWSRPSTAVTRRLAPATSDGIPGKRSSSRWEPESMVSLRGRCHGDPLMTATS